MKKGLLLASALLVSGAAVAQTAISEEVNKSLAHWLSVPVIKQDLSKAQMLQAEMAEQGNATVAKAAAKKAIKNSLEDESEQLHDKLDKLLGTDKK